jgi:hypothetical protein
MSDSLNLASKVVASQEQVACELTDEVVILNLRNGEYYGLNPVGAKIWTMIQEPRTVADIRDAILAEYEELTPDECTQDVLELLQQLADSELLEVVVTTSV